MQFRVAQDAFAPDIVLALFYCRALQQVNPAVENNFQFFLQRGLATLARPDQNDDAAAGQGCFNVLGDIIPSLPASRKAIMCSQRATWSYLKFQECT